MERKTASKTMKFFRNNVSFAPQIMKKDIFCANLDAVLYSLSKSRNESSLLLHYTS